MWALVWVGGSDFIGQGATVRWPAARASFPCEYLRSIVSYESIAGTTVSVNMASTYVRILCGAQSYCGSNQNHSFMQNGGLFGECHVPVMHYRYWESCMSVAPLGCVCPVFDDCVCGARAWRPKPSAASTPNFKQHVYTLLDLCVSSSRRGHATDFEHIETSFRYHDEPHCFFMYGFPIISTTNVQQLATYMFVSAAWFAFHFNHVVILSCFNWTYEM